MNWIKTRPVVFLIGLIFSFPLFGQTNDTPVIINDLWTGFSLKYKLNKKVAFNLDHQVRVTEDLKKIRSTLFEFGVKYKFNKHFYTRIQHRYTIRNEQRHVNRLAIDANGKWNIKPARIELTYRFRFQHGVVTYTKERSTFLRNRIQAKFKVSNAIKLFARYESYYQFNDKNRFRQNLYAAGIDFQLKKNLDLSLFYRIDQKINTKKPEIRNIVAVLLKFEI